MRRLFVIAALFIAAGCGDGGSGHSSASLHAGDLDPSFGESGVVTSDFGTLAQATSVAIAPDGKIVAAGSVKAIEGFSIAIARFNSDGTPDAAFGSNGRIVTASGGNAGASAIALDANGKIVIAGSSGRDWLVARYNPDGSLDADFGTGGLVTTSVGASLVGGRATAVAIQADGKIVAAGLPEGSPDANLALVRFDTDGTLDAPFGDAGIVTATVVTSLTVNWALVLQSDGKLLAGGTAVVSADRPSPEFGFGFTLVRYLPSGAPDETFGTGGVVLTDVTPGRNSGVSAIAVQPDGDIVAAGGAEGIPGAHGGGRSALARYKPNGTLDEHFGTNGFVITRIGLSNGTSGVALQSDGKIIVAGSTLLDPGTSTAFTLARYTSDGMLDVSFGDAGTRTTEIGNASLSAGMSLQDDSHVVVAGHVRTGSRFEFALARYFVGGE